MTDIAKFITDVQKIMKRDRQNNGGKSDFGRCTQDVRKLFERSSTCPGELPGTIYYYWESEYTTTDPANEPTEEHLNKLAGMLAFLNSSDEYQDCVTDEDWQEMGNLVGYEAEDLPIDILQELMKVLVSKGAY